MKKKGLANIITTVLLVLFVIVSIIIIWNVVKFVITEKTKDIETGFEGYLEMLSGEKEGDCPGSAVCYYVSNTGKDSNPGTINSPFKTIQRARDAIRINGQDGNTVYLREGVYELDNTLEFINSDSGRAGLENIYMSYPGEEAVISGGKKIESRWDLHSGNIYKTNVGDWDFNSLFVNDKRAIRAREPDGIDENYYLIKSVDQDETNTTSFRFNIGEIDPNWENLMDVEVVSLMRWIQSRFRIDKIEEGDKVYFQGSLPSNRGYSWDYDDGANSRYYVENALELLDQPGEWYLDKTTRDLYYWPLAEEDINSVEVVAPVLEKMISFNRIKHITFKNLVFAHTDWILPEEGSSSSTFSWELNASIYFINTDYCAIENSIIKHIGNNVIDTDFTPNRNLNIVGNEIYDIGAGGLFISGQSGQEDYIESAIISDNIIHDIGKVHKGPVAVYLRRGVNSRVSHNLIYNAPYTGIIILGDAIPLSWSPNYIEYNEIHSVMQELNDGGAIYGSGQQPGSLIQNNLIHDVTGTDMHTTTWGTIQGIYLDEGGREYIIKNNLVYRTDNGLLLHYSPNNLITNNIFVDGYSWDLAFSMHVREGGDFSQPGNNFTKNIVYTTKDGQLFRIYEDKDGKNPVEWSDYNLFYTNDSEKLDNTGSSGWNLIWWKTTYGFDQNSIVEDPLFGDYANDNFMLQTDSPAFSLGFEQIDVSKVGPRKKCSNNGDCQASEACVLERCTERNVCGNKLKDPEEECDGADFGGQTCQLQGFDFGTLYCLPNCSIDTSSCGFISDLPTDYVSYWSFEDGTANDVTGKNNGTLNGNAHIEDNVLVLDGVAGNYVETASFSISPTSGKSGCAWIYPLAHTNNNAGVFRHRYAYSMRIYEGKIADRIVNSTGGISQSYFSTNILTNEWSFVCVTWESPGIGQNLLLKYYLNGVEDGNHTTDITDANGLVGSSDSSTLRIGSDPDVSSRIFNGSIDDVMIFNRSLSLNEVKALYNS